MSTPGFKSRRTCPCSRITLHSPGEPE